METEYKLLKNLREDLPASLVVFLVALPLCLGIALTSGAPLYSGLISGIIGGVVVGFLSGSALGVSGPAAGLAVIVLAAIAQLGSFEAFLAAVVLAGILQLIMGFVGAGVIGYYFPSSVIHGMLAGIGMSIFMKQLPHIVGDDENPEGDLEFFQSDGENTFTELIRMLQYINPGILIISIISLTILILWEKPYFKQFRMVQLLPAPLLVVVAGILLSLFFNSNGLFIIKGEHLVTIPISTSTTDFFNNFSFPDFSVLMKKEVYLVAFLLAIVASLETLLSVEAIDKIDTLKRITPTNRELKAQGVGNIISGLVGGLPITQVIVRSSANQQSGAKTKKSTIFHGLLLLISVIVIPNILNMIPVAALASILLLIGYKLAKPSLFKKMYVQGMEQFIPFVATILGILFTDLLIGIFIGLMVSVLILVWNNHRVSYHVEEIVNGEKIVVRIQFPEIVTFLDKASILKTLMKIKDGAHLELDAQKTHFIHHDVLEILNDFKINALSRDIVFTWKGLQEEDDFLTKNNLTTSKT